MGEMQELLDEVDKALKAAGFLDELPASPIKSVDQIRTDVPNAVGQVNALIKLLNAWPKILAALDLTEEWRPMETATLVAALEQVASVANYGVNLPDEALSECQAIAEKALGRTSPPPPPSTGGE